MSGNRYFSESYSKLTFKRAVETSEGNVLTDEEVARIEAELEVKGLDFYGVKVNKTEGIYFDMTEEGNLYEAETDLVEVFSTVKDTVVFSGLVEIRAFDIDEYERFEITDSAVTAQKSAQITWS
jgi:hypothetical protein